MAPLRIENGRLDIDWSTIGLIASRYVGLKVEDGRATAAIDTDIKFIVTAGIVCAANAPRYELVLHASGESTGKASDAASRDLPIAVRIAEKDAQTAGGALRGDLSVSGRPSKNGDAYDVSDMSLNLDSPTCLALYAMNRKTREFRLKFKEERVLKNDLSITQSNNLLIIRLESTDVGAGFDFTQKPNGEAELSFNQGIAKRFVRAAGLHELTQKYMAEMQLNFFRPLSDAGVQIALSPELPVTMAAAAAGFSDPLPEHAKKADALIQAIAEAATPEDRARAVTDLTRFFPQAIFRVAQAAGSTRDPLLKAALQKVIAAHPGIAAAMPFVKLHKLHEDREYLFDIFEHVPLLKDAARARLAVLYGKDYGDDPEVWKKK